MRYEASQIAIETARTAYANAIRARIALEHAARPHDAIIHTLESKHLPRAKYLTAYELAYAAAHSFDFTAHFTSSEKSRESRADKSASGDLRLFNEKAIPKCIAVMRALNGAAFDVDGSKCSDDETTAGVVLALARGICEEKQITFACDDYMNRAGRGRGSYHSGQTQSSSSLRAMEVFGIVRFAEGRASSGTKLWEIANRALFNRLHDAAMGKVDHAPVDAPLAPPVPLGWQEVDTSVNDTATLPTPASDAETTPSVDVLAASDVLALAAAIDASESVPVPASDPVPVPVPVAPVAKRSKRAKHDPATFINPYTSINPDTFLAAA